MLIGQQLVQLANESDLVKSYLGIPKDWKNIVRITKNAIVRMVGENQFNAQFIGSRRYKTKLTTNQMIRLIEGGAFKYLGKRFGMEDYYNAIFTFQPRIGRVKDYQRFVWDTTGDLNPDADPETTTCDGFLRESTLDQTWAAIRGSTTADTVNDSGNDMVVAVDSSATTDRWDRIDKAHTGFDTSVIDDGATIDAGTWSVYVSSVTDNFNQLMGIVSSSPASNTSLAVGDFDGLGTSRYATDIDLTSLSTSAYNDWTLNATGLAAVNDTGVTNIGVRLSGDLDNTEPTWQSSVEGSVLFDSAEKGANDPKLNITFTPAGWSGGTLSGTASANISTFDSTAIANISTINTV
jgi:hypothetical protein